MTRPKNRTASRLAMLALTSVLLVGTAVAQQMSNACGTRFGVCPVGWGPVGAGCGCGRDPGRLILPPFSDACGTRFGICRTYPGQLGDRCACYGDPGRIVPPPR